MPRLMYVGLKPEGERAFMDKTGIEWMPGSSHEVSAEHAALMLKHPDVWALVEEVEAEADEFAGLSDAEVVAPKRKPGRPRKDA